ncbi:arylesterase [Limnobacter sp.]|uniref:arylesterase n=1 Tax=Limnobacter sp. TaxID=2003368 RepID=UPI00351479FD
MIALTAKTIKKTLVLAALALSSVTSVSAFAAAQPKPCKILVLGDSLSAAYGLPVEQGWVALMEKRLAEKFPHCSVVNASVSGETTAGGKTRLPDLLKKHQPSHMILQLGANDGLRGLSLEAMKDNLNGMLVMARRAEAQALLVGMQIPPNYGPTYTRQFAQTFADLARKQKVPFVPFLLDGFAQDPSAFQADGIHPAAQVQPVMLNNVWRHFEGTLK